MAELLKQQNFSGFDLSKLQASLYDVKLARGTDEYLARFVGWESRTEEGHDVALFALKVGQGEQVRRLVFKGGAKIDDPRRLKTLFTLVFSARRFENEELIPTEQELEMVK
ncbi:MAG TPA: hypothetical protein VM912_02170 [Terriglobales bacterium]|nr:hypothetical protein [Terriglobales bacterium]